MRQLYRDIVAPALLPLMSMTRMGMRVDEDVRQKLLGAAQEEANECVDHVCGLASRYTGSAMPALSEVGQCPDHPDYRGEAVRRACIGCADIWAQVRTWRTSTAYKKAKRLESFNPGSKDHLGWLLFEALALPVLERTPTGRPKVSLGVIEALLEHRKTPDGHLGLLRALARLAHANKRISVDLNPPIEADGRVHPHYTLEGTAIGRIRSGIERFDADKTAGEAYNAQNVPEEARAIYVPDPGCVLVELDARQIEWVLMMLLARSARAVAAYAAGHDVHMTNARTIVAPALFGEVWDELSPDVQKERRTDTKTFTHGVDYGEGDFNLARRFGVKVKVAATARERYLGEWPEIREWQEGVHEEALRSRSLRNPFGRQRRFLDVTAKMAGGVKRLMLNDKAYKEALAFGPASTNADLWKICLRKLYDAGYVVVTGTHDSFLIQVPENDVTRCVEGALTLCQESVPELAGYVGKEPFVPLWGAKVGLNWGPESVGNPNGLKKI